MEERILIAGAGGQGALTIGKFLATVAMDNHRVTYFPSYGAEVRGGAAHCHVVISGAAIASPVVEAATILILMNQLSYGRFISRMAPDGLLVLNSSLIRHDAAVPCGRLIEVPATQLASEIGDIRVANMVLLGAMLHLRPIIDLEVLHRVMRDILGKDSSKTRLLDMNERALKVGLEQARQLA